MKVVLIAGTVLLIAGCDSNGRDGSVSTGAVTGAATDQAASAPPSLSKESRQSLMATRATAEGAAQDAASPGAQRGEAALRAQGASEIAPTMLIRSGSASIEVDRLDPAIVKVRQLATQLGGYIANSSISGGRDQMRSATLEMKIPAARYDQAITGLGGIGKVEAVNTSVEDVGEEYVDLTARVTNAKRLEERLVGLLATRTGKLEDVLAVERELARVREEIERFEGRMRFLRTRAAVSTLSVTVHEPAPILGQMPGENPIVGALKQAWRNFVGFIAAMIASLGILIPLAALGVVGWIIFRRIRRSR
ncbi:MAG TPA: DUF4349 domain-containing protein [Gemmatimonadaceae bacterium]|nr:DUF4349 domain-containing protein [Gemmatimonadaceae bacterium]